MREIGGQISGAKTGTAVGVVMVSMAISVLAGDPALYFRLLGKGSPPVRIVGGPSDLGTVAANSTCVTDVVIVNQSSEPVEIIGGGVSCGCMTLNSIPLTIPPRQHVSLKVQIKIPATSGPLKKSFAYFLRHPRQFRVVGTIVGQVREPAAVAQLNHEQINPTPRR